MAVLAAVAGGWTALHYRAQWQRSRRQAERSRSGAKRLGEQFVAAEVYLGHLSQSVLPALSAAAQGGRGPGAGPVIPPQLAGTPLAGRLQELAGQLGVVVGQVAEQSRATATQQVGEVRAEGERRIAQARQEAVQVAEAAVRSFANTVVERATKLGDTISDGVRRHVSDEAYATLVEIDHLAQQMLLTGSGYVVLAGGKLTRRWPATTLTDIIGMALGRIEGYERVEYPENDQIAVRGRGVEAVVHTLAVLLDNAAKYSPPSARVHVTVQPGHRGCSLIVDDSGIQMGSERLDWARGVLSGQRGDITQLGAFPQAGLRVVSVLAESYGFHVELTAPNLFHGTRAVILLPPELLTTSAREQPAEQHAAPADAGSEPAVAAATTARGLTRRQKGATAGTVPALRALPAAPVEPGSPSVAAAWHRGTQRARADQKNSATDEDIDHGC
ncbi:ATP-binding protein [Streptomyces shenzhenensis]|uniref:ATP-binding protein n=1 Tax=Streptomyces shenzhenensis TaxID=943815 RepID=UPI0033EAE525